MANQAIKMKPCNYAGGAPEGYSCGDCGAHGVKLWREYQTIMSKQELRCAACAEKHQINCHAPGWESPYAQGQGDQIGWLVPAVPTEEGDTFWGYSAVPQPGVEWWHRLGSTLAPPCSAQPSEPC